MVVLTSVAEEDYTEYFWKAFKEQCSQHWFTKVIHKGPVYLILYPSIHDILQVDKGKVVVGTFLDFHKAVPHSIILEKIVHCGM